MPFTPEARNAESEAVALRLTEGVTAELVRDGRFSVVASSAARAEHAPARRPRDIAAALDADIVVEARVTTDGERVGVEARAASGQTELKLWVRSFAGDSADTDALEREIAAAVADELSTQRTLLFSRRVNLILSCFHSIVYGLLLAYCTKPTNS